ncbi:hypothetical protein ACROYT_G036132 [Oculina patagonica]
MKPFCPVVLILAVFVVSSYFLLITASATTSNLRQQERASWNHGRRINRDVSSNHTSGSANTTQVQNVTTTGVPTVATTDRRPLFGWPTRRRNTPRPTRSALNLTGLTEVQIHKLLKGNKSEVPLDHLGFPIIPNSHRGTRRPPPRTERNASHPTQNSGKDRNGNSSHEIIDELRKRENGTQASTLRPNTNTTSTNSIDLISKVPHPEGAQKESRNDNRRGISLVIAKHSIWISVVASLLLSALICLTVHWVLQKKRGKLTIAPASNKSQRSPAVIFKA